MAPEKSPAFQFYPGDFMSDGNVSAMTLTERGAYITLLCLCWQERSLPCEMPRLARLCGVTEAAFTRLWPALAPCFTASRERLRQKRLDRERVKQKHYRRRQSNAGKASAAARQRTSNHKATTVEPERQPKSSLRSSVSDLRTNVREKIAAAPLASLSFEKFWNVYPKHSGRKAALVYWSQLAPDEAFSALILSGVEAYSAHVRGWKPEYIKAPLRWLEGAHWEDELGEKQPIGAAAVDACPHDPPCAVPGRWKCAKRTEFEAVKQQVVAEQAAKTGGAAEKARTA